VIRRPAGEASTSLRSRPVVAGGILPVRPGHFWIWSGPAEGERSGLHFHPATGRPGLGRFNDDFLVACRADIKRFGHGCSFFLFLPGNEYRFHYARETAGVQGVSDRPPQTHRKKFGQGRFHPGRNSRLPNSPVAPPCDPPDVRFDFFRDSPGPQ
jgi:hypothetical protein